MNIVMIVYNYPLNPWPCVCDVQKGLKMVAHPSFKKARTSPRPSATPASCSWTRRSTGTTPATSAGTWVESCWPSATSPP